MHRIIHRRFDQGDTKMQLKKKAIQPPILGLPASPREWWDIGDGYEIFVIIGQKAATFWVTNPEDKDITYEVAKIFNLDVSEEHLSKRYKGDDEVYASMSLTCVGIHYRKPENYKAFLEKIEKVINEHFKNK